TRRRGNLPSSAAWERTCRQTVTIWPDASGEFVMANGNGTPPEAAPPPQLNVLAQYTKDLSFENPNAPKSLGQQQQQPSINIQINVGANNIAENEFEVVLSIEGKAESQGMVMFNFELAY